MNQRRSQLAASLAALPSAHVLCVGDVMLDRFVSGPVERISPEAPVPVMRISKQISMLGGAGNAARNLAAVNARTHFVSVVGDDAAGREVADMLAQLPQVEPILEVIPGHKTGVKVRYVSGGQQLLRVDHETAAPLPQACEASMIAQIGHLVDSCQAVLCSDYGKGALSERLIRAVIEHATHAGVPVLIDPKGRDYARYRGATFLTSNHRELRDAIGMPTDTDSQVVAAARAVAAAYEIEGVIATRGRDGMTLVMDDEARHLPTETLEIFDVSGAGDTVAAVATAALAAGAEVRDAVELSNIAAGVVVGKSGTAVATVDDLLEAMHGHDLKNLNRKIVSDEAAVRRAAAWKGLGLRVGFTNGCFDLLHLGHLSLLRQARAACDRLIVGLNTDASTRRLKGEGRPVQTETTRAAVLASLSGVDAIVMFAEDTPRRLIEALKPDALIKGADYARDAVVGREIVEAYGGAVVLAQLEQDQSTTATIARINSGLTVDEDARVECASSSAGSGEYVRRI